MPLAEEVPQKESKMLLKENLDTKKPALYFGLILGFVITSVILMKLSNKKGANSN